MTRHPALAAALAASLSLALAGCSFSDSSKSSSDSSGSSSTSSASISASSAPKGSVSKDKQAYRDDVANLTYSIANTGITASEYPQALARTARTHKINNWAGEKATYYGIGKGLKKAGVPKDAIARQAFLGQVLAGNKDALKLIQDGYSD